MVLCKIGTALNFSCQRLRQSHLEPQELEHDMDLYNARSLGKFVKLKVKIAVYKCMYQKVLRRLREHADRESNSNTGPPLRPEITISSLTEIGQAQEYIKVPKQWVYTGRQPVIPSSLADTPCSSLGIQGLLDLLNTTLGTSYTLETLSLSSVLKDCIVKNYDFGTAYGRLRRTWCNPCWSTIQIELWEREAEDIKLRKKAVKGSRIVSPLKQPRRVWDLYSNRVVPWWCCRVDYNSDGSAKPISHAWVDEVDRVDVWTPINGCEWPVPIPKGANLDLIRIEMLNLGVEYTWLDVLCLRQRGGPREDLRVEEWKLDVPTIGATYRLADVVTYLSGLGLPLSLKEGDLESDRCWFRRAWTVQELGRDMMIAGDTPDGPLHAKPVDDAGNYEDEILTKFHKLLVESTSDYVFHGYAALSAMQNRISTYPIDKVAGVSFSLFARSIPAYYESQSLEDAWTALVNVMLPRFRALLFLTYPEPGTGCKKWRPSWEQVMEESLPHDTLIWPDVPNVSMDDDGYDRYEGLCIERGFVRGLAVEGEERINRHGELIVEDADGTPHSFNIVASHSFQIIEDTYTLLGGWNRLANTTHRYWVLGRRLPGNEFEKVSVFTIPDPDELNRLEELGLYVESSTGILL